MNETKLEANSGTIAKIRYDSENLALRKFRNVCKIFATSNSKNFFFLKNKNKIINK